VVWLRRQGMNLKCLVGIHDWVEDFDFDDDWGGVVNAYHCERCGLIKQIVHSDKAYKFRKYYREYLKSSGWGVMIGYDTVLADSMSDAKKAYIPLDMYGSVKEFSYIKAVGPKHLHLSDEKLSKIYGINSDEMSSVYKGREK
jgi:hypothetical protein